MTSFEPLAIRLCLSPARLTVREHLSGARSLVPLKPDSEWLVPLPKVAQAAMHSVRRRIGSRPENDPASGLP